MKHYGGHRTLIIHSVRHMRVSTLTCIKNRVIAAVCLFVCVCACVCVCVCVRARACMLVCYLCSTVGGS